MIEDSDSITSVTYNSVSLEYIDAAFAASTKAYAYYLDEEDFPLTPGSYTVQANSSGSVRAAMTVIELENCRQGAVDSDDPSTISASFLIGSVNVANGAWIVAGSACEALVTITQTTGTTIYSTDMGSQFEYCFGYEIQTSAGTGTVRHNISVTPFEFCMMAVAVQPIDASRALFFGAGF